VSPVKCVLGFYIPEDDILRSHRHENLKFYTFHGRLQKHPFIEIPGSVTHAIESVACVSPTGLTMATTNREITEEDRLGLTMGKQNA
jgi:hypothetical protein